MRKSHQENENSQAAGGVSRRTFLSKTPVVTGAALHSVSRLGNAGQEDRYTVCLLAYDPAVRDFISWRLWDPHVLELGLPTFQGPSAGKAPDVLILGDREPSPNPQKPPQPLLDFLAALDQAGGAIAFQPASLNQPPDPKILSRFAARYRGWNHETPPFSAPVHHPFNAGFGRVVGRSVIPHVYYDWNLELEAAGAETAIAFSPDTPNLLVSDRAVLTASNMVAHVVQLHRHPSILEFRRDVSTVLVNSVRVALGAEPLSTPVTKHCLAWRDRFYGYAYGRDFIFKLLDLVEGTSGETRQTVHSRIAAADRDIHAAAAHLRAGEIDGIESLYRDAAERLLACRQAITKVQPFFVRGWHGGLLEDRVVDGELVGHAEWGWPSRTMQWTEMRLEASERLGFPQLNQVAGQTWDQIADSQLTDLDRWRRATEAGLVENVKGMYSDAYLEILGTESNIRQFEYGLRAFDRIGGRVRTFMVAYDDFAFHPQLPQILRGFGFDFAVVRCGGPGEIRGIDHEKIRWEGEDGTTIDAAPMHDAVHTPRLSGIRGGINQMAEMIATADKAGFRHVLNGGATDDTMYIYAEQEAEALNATVPVQAQYSVYADYFEQADLHPEAIRYSVDDLFGKPWFWTGYGSLNECCREDREIERLLTTAERFSALAWQDGRRYPQAAFDRAWQCLLSSQDHFTYACGGPCNPEGYHVSGLQEKAIPLFPGPKTPIKTEDTSQRWKSIARKAGQSGLRSALQHLCPAGSAPGVAVFNALNWGREGLVRATVTAPGDTKSVAMFDGSAEVPATILGRRGAGADAEFDIAFHGSAPSLGLRTYTPRFSTKAPAANTGSAPVLENRYIRVEVDPETGSITRLFDKSTNTELLRPDEVTRIVCSTPEIDSSKDSAEVELTRSDTVLQEITVRGKLAGSPYEARYTLAAGEPWLRLDIDLDCGDGAIFGFKGQQDYILRLVLPLRTGERWVNQPFGVYRTESETQVALDYCIARGEGSSLAIFHDGVPGLRFDNGNVEPLLADGFPPLRGMQHFKLALYPHAGDPREGAVLQQAHEFQHSLIAHAPSGGVPVPYEASYLETPDKVILSGLQVRDDKLAARLYDISGAGRAVATRWKQPWASASAARLDGTPEKQLPVDEGRIEFDLPAWGIQTIIGEVEA